MRSRSSKDDAILGAVVGSNHSSSRRTRFLAAKSIKKSNSFGVDSTHTVASVITTASVDDMLDASFHTFANSSIASLDSFHESLDEDPLHQGDDVIRNLVKVELLKDSPVEVLIALKQLVELTHSGPSKKEYKREALQLKAHSFVVSTMLKWRSSSQIQYEACFCLSVLCCKNGHVKSEIVQAGGVDAIALAMRKFPNSLKVHFRACSLLWTLFATPSPGSASWLNGAAERFIKDLNGLKYIKRAMKKFPEDGDLQAMCCILLVALSAYCEKKTMIGDKSIVLAVAGAMDSYKEHDDVQKYGQQFMQHVLT